MSNEESEDVRFTGSRVAQNFILLYRGFAIRYRWIFRKRP